MKRRAVHALFAAAAAACGLAAALQATRLHDAIETNRAVAEASRVPALGTLTATGATPPADAHAAPETRLAEAIALAQAGRYEQALDAYKALARAADPALRRAALYDIGNLHLREARRDGGDPTRTLALVELAKQSYRDLLRADPADWAARYNLERALWLAPEPEDDTEELPPPLQSERAITTMRSDRGELP